MADRLLHVPRFDGTKLEHAMTNGTRMALLNLMALYVHFGNGKSGLVSEYERYPNSSSGRLGQFVAMSPSEYS
jgi:hypothetical protein